MNKTNVYVKSTIDGKSRTLEYTSSNFTIDDIKVLDKIISEKNTETEANKNKSFKAYVNSEKNNLQE